ncbi:Protein bir1 [Fusarium austroafricanum]|uniref:Protein bir1 n=1 Tax=Fusarium austroafricanum TaxID=2364996 RepID=A0A8H4KIS2_9HYPO|nr:Protein bir1 [Fusarium austroafricanum]
MSFDDVTDQFITYESRLASFQKNAKKRGSTASGRGTKALNWPHKSITPASLARAGLFFNPTPQNPDNASCFLCHKGLDGWEANDDPLVEHLTHSPECGWAVVAAIEAEVGDYAQQDPDQPYMKEARKATFAGRWPHDPKKGWKCKTKQLVDAGWKYTPTEDSDDMATCTYCQLALDGWEPGDKPFDEHYNRSPGCPFFILLEQSQSTKKSTRTKAGRASKASRLSVQSVATIASEAPSINESTVAIDDSILTTSSTAQGGKKTKSRKATTKGRKTKTKKETPAEDTEVSIQEEAPPPTKSSRGKKRDSSAVEDASNMAISPPGKKRATRKPGNVSVNESTLQHDEEADVTETVAPKKGGKKKTTRKPTAKSSSRNVSSGSTTSEVVTTSYEATPGTFPDDDEIERQLEADLERQLSDDEEISADSDSERRQSKKGKGVKASPTRAEQLEYSRDYAMLNPQPVEPNEDEVDDELRALQAEMEVDEEPRSEPEAEHQPEPKPEPEHQELHIPKKGRKAGTRKVSKQTKSKKTKAAPEPVEEDEIEPEHVYHEDAEVPQEETTQSEVQAEVDETTHDDSLVSTDTVIKKSVVSRSSAGKRGRGRPSRASLASQASADELELVEAPAEPTAELPKEQPAKRSRGRPSKASLASRRSAGADESQLSDVAPKRGRGRPSKKSLEARKSMEAAASQESTQPFTQPMEERMREDVEVYASEEQKEEEQVHRVVSFESKQASPAAQPMPSSPPQSAAHLANPPSTPGRIISPAPSARQAAISPSQSPQSSDAENQPPSSKPNASANPKRVALAPMNSTPTRSSPSRRNVIVGLRSTAPWTELDLEAVFGSPRVNSDKENGVGRYLKQGQTLTSPEKQMTVQEWIYYNASEAEKKLKHECESIVNRFESEGTKAMRVLEGLVME